MPKPANIYDICDDVLLREKAAGEPGRNLQLLYRTVAKNLLFRFFVLRACRHPDIQGLELTRMKTMMRRALSARYQNWQDATWINTTFRPLADMLDRVEAPDWQSPNPAPATPSGDLDNALDEALQAVCTDIMRVWNKDRRDPYFPVAAQVQPSGDDLMDGAGFLNVLCGLGSYQYQNITVLFALIRCLVAANPKKLNLLRKPFLGISEPLSLPRSWIWHRTAYYDAFFFDHLLDLLATPGCPLTRDDVVPVLENLVHYIVVDSREELVSPGREIAHPSLTCLPAGDGSAPPCRLSKKDWEMKRTLGFGDYVPDLDTTFLGLSVAQKWLRFVADQDLECDGDLLVACEDLLDHPYLEVLHDYQVDGEGAVIGPTITISKPLDYSGALPIWFDKAFRKADGQVIVDALGNEVCPGHNMDLLESILVNRVRWGALKGENLGLVRNLLEFHHRAYTSGVFQESSAFIYYLPIIYVYFTGRMFRAYNALDDHERQTLDPDGKVGVIRSLAQAYCENLLQDGPNVYDAALIVSTLLLLDPTPEQDTAIEQGLQILVAGLGEGANGHPYRAYEWTRMRHPTRVIVGSPVATSFFVLHALSLAKQHLGRDNDAADR